MKPYVFCHMLTSVDGKINGNFLKDEHTQEASQLFKDVTFGRRAPYKIKGWLAGRATTDERFTHYHKPDLKRHPICPDGDFIINEDRDYYYISVDPTGVLGWQHHKVNYGQEAYVVEVLTAAASKAYKEYLRRHHIPYIICGEHALDYEIMLDKLKRIFNIDVLLLGGGAVLNWSFIQSGLCDELSVVIAPSADGSPISQSAFMKVGPKNNGTVSFELIEASTYEKSTVWLRYKINHS